MAYEKKSIRAIIDDVNSRRVYLPAIQRKYVWGDSQITKLMDSIMLGYPIGTFLLWKVKKSIVNQKEYSMYEFIKDYHDRDMYKNPTAPQPFPIGSVDETIWAILDGQQRLTSLYIALQGSMSRKLPNKRWKNDDAFPKKELYFDLHSEKTYDEDISYEFRFLTSNEATNNKNDKVWYLVKDILKYSAEELLTEVIIPNGWATDIVAIKNISLLHTRLVTDEIINYFEVEKDSIDSVLDIFVRVNSGGTVLSKSDLLFSTIVSHWDKARDEIDKLLSEINKKGEGFKFSNDFIMRTCLYLLDMSVALKVETFKKDSVLKIKENWDAIQEAIKDTVDLLNEFGFNSENMKTLPLANLPDGTTYVTNASYPVQGINISYVIPAAGLNNYTKIHQYIQKAITENVDSVATARLLVLNGSGERGAASDEKLELEKVGFKNIETDNAPTSDYQDITIYQIGEKPVTKKGLTDYYKIEVKDKSELPQGIKSHGYDFVVIRGKETAKKITN